jgi:hypothetical protein
MNTAERVRAAAEATAASVRQIRPLSLPESSAASAEFSEDRGRDASRARRTLTRMKETWMIPLGAAAAVAALTLSLVTIRHAEPPRPAPANGAAAAIAGIPRYYAIANEGPTPHDGPTPINVTVGDVRTGKTLAVVAVPPTYGDSVVGLSAAADDRTFVVGRRDSWGNVEYFTVHITPGAKQVGTVKLLPIALTSPGVLLGAAVSPDGKQLATLSVRGNGTTLRVYSVTTGAILRTWIAPTWRNQAAEEWRPSVSWTADSRHVAFSTVVITGQGTQRNPPSGMLVERIVNATAPTGDLATVSKIVLKAPGNCTSLLLTPDGGTVVCATQVNALVPLAKPTACGGKYGPRFVAYSAATGKRLRVLYQYPGPCKSALDLVLWSDASARHVIGEAYTTFTTNSPPYTIRYGVATGGKFVKFPVAKHSQGYSGPAF